MMYAFSFCTLKSCGDKGSGDSSLLINYSGFFVVLEQYLSASLEFWQEKSQASLVFKFHSLA